MSGASNAKGWREAPSAVALCAWRDADLARLAARLEGALRAWAADWGIGGVRGASCMAASRWVRRDGEWRLLGSTSAGHAWIHRSDASCARAWLGELDAPTPVAQAVADRCLQDAHARLARLAGLGCASCDPDVPAATWSAWSGAVIAELPLDTPLLLSAGVVRRMLGASSPVRTAAALAPAAEAVSHRAVRLQVELEGCQLSLGELASLQAGDVLRLRHATDMPARVHGSAGELLFEAWLARSRGRRAVELAGLGSVSPRGEGVSR